MQEGIFPLILYSKYKTQMTIPLLYLLIHTKCAFVTTANQYVIIKNISPGTHTQEHDFMFKQYLCRGQNNSIVPGVVHATLRNTSAVWLIFNMHRPQANLVLH